MKEEREDGEVGSLGRRGTRAGGSSRRLRGWRRVGVLGMGEPVVYTWPLRQRGIGYEVLEPGLRAELDAAAFRLMEGRASDETAAVARRAVGFLRARGVDDVILGCTEIPLLLGDAADAADLVNPAEHLAEAAVRAAMGEADRAPA